MMDTIYPDFSVHFEMYIKDKKTYSRSTFSTTVRKKHRGCWYLIRLFNRYEFEYIGHNWFNSYLKAQKQFLTEVYKTILFTKINLKSINPESGNRVYELDTNQQNEYERFVYVPKK